MLSARNVILTIVALAISSILFTIISLAMSDGRSQENRDFYGTKGEGFRAVYELLEKFDIPVERTVIPPAPENYHDSTLALWSPDQILVSFEPVYIKNIRDWVVGGGHLVLTLPKNDSMGLQNLMAMKNQNIKQKDFILDQLGLPGVHLDIINRKKGNSSSKNEEIDFSDEPYEFALDIQKQLKKSQTRFHSLPVEITGDWSSELKDVKSLEIPLTNLHTLDFGSEKPTGVISVVQKDNEKHVIGASFQIGQGEIILISEPFIAQNRAISKSDNSILLTHILTSSGNNVIFDGFYHGAMVRGNPFWLYSLPGYGAMTFTILVLLGVVIWRKAIFLGPPLEEENEISRRSIKEYIEAMGTLFTRGKSIYPFYLKTVRDGAIRTLRTELELHPGRDNYESIVQILSRKDPERCRAFSESIDNIDSLLMMNKKCNEREVVSATRKVVNCL